MKKSLGSNPLIYSLNCYRQIISKVLRKEKVDSDCNIITVFADASYKNHVAGYAIWGRGPKSMSFLEFSQAIPWLVETSDEAETLALAHAISAALDRFASDKKDNIIVAESDCLGALAKMRLIGGIPAKSSDRPIGSVSKMPEGTVFDFLRRAKEKLHMYDAKLYLKHVKGHVGGPEARSSVNRWCDRTAKEARLRAEKLLKELN